MIQEFFSFFKEKEIIGESNIFTNSSGRYADGCIEISGTATSFTLKVQAKVDFNSNQWTDLCVINESDLSSGGSINANGIYSFSCAGKRIRLSLTEVTGGYVDAFASFIG